MSSFTQKIAERETALETLKQDHVQRVEELVSRHKEELKSLQENRDDVVSVFCADFSLVTSLLMYMYVTETAHGFLIPVSRYSY